MTLMEEAYLSLVFLKFFMTRFACVRLRTGDGFLVMLYGASSLHLHHASLNATVVDVTEILHVLLHSFGHRVGGGGSEAALVLLKVLMVSHLSYKYNHSLFSYDFLPRHAVLHFFNDEDGDWSQKDFCDAVRQHEGCLRLIWCAGSLWHASSQVCPEQRQPCPGPAYGSCQSRAPDGGWGWDDEGAENGGNEHVGETKTEAITPLESTHSGCRRWGGHTGIQLLTDELGHNWETRQIN